MFNIPHSAMLEERGTVRSCAPPVPEADQDQGRLPERGQPAETALSGRSKRQQEMDDADPGLEHCAVAAGHLLRGPA